VEPTLFASRSDRVRWVSAALLLLAFACSGAPVAPRVAPRAEITPAISNDSYLADVKFLADDRLEGRMTGSPGGDEAARFIADRFKAIGLAPGGDAGGYLQHFDAVSGRQVEKTTKATVGGRDLALGRDFAVVEGSGSASGSGGLLFLGYGIDFAPANRHDYDGHDVAGKVVVALMGGPGRAAGSGDFVDTKPGGEAVKARKKAIAAYHAKAAGLILVNDSTSEASTKNGEGFEKWPDSFDEIGDGLSFPAIHVTAAFGRELLHQGGVDLDAALAKLDAGESIAQPLGSATATLKIDTAPIHRPTANVVGILKGDGSHGDEHLIVGAHYDHLGWGSGASLARGVHAIHHGADDNASGTAAVLAIAKSEASRSSRPPRTVVFVCFSGEELGLLGSKHYSEHPSIPLAKCVAMLNLDMVGRSREGYCAIGAIGSAAPFKGLAEKENEALHLGLKLDPSDGGMSMGSSDHQTFLDAKVPSLFFFSGLHEDYHRPSDTSDKINADGAVRITKLCDAILEDLEAVAEKPAFVAVAPAATDPHAASASAQRGEGRPWFGSIPEFGASGDGVLFSGVSAGSPAEKAGLAKGDRLVEWNGRPVKTLADFSALLSSAQVGDKVKVAIVRGAERKEFEITLAVKP
jgi:peptidase M28-like protein/PDZ domain-containing protein/PA domain-containing protein